MARRLAEQVALHPGASWHEFERGTNAIGTATSSNATLVVVTFPTITLQPRPRETTIYAGEAASFTVAATGALPLNYQWYFNGEPMHHLTPPCTATPAALTLGGWSEMQISSLRQYLDAPVAGRPHRLYLAVTTDCNRACLAKHLDQYLGGLVAHRPEAAGHC